MRAMFVLTASDVCAMFVLVVSVLCALFVLVGGPLALSWWEVQREGDHVKWEGSKVIQERGHPLSDGDASDATQKGESGESARCD